MSSRCGRLAECVGTGRRGLDGPGPCANVAAARLALRGQAIATGSEHFTGGCPHQSRIVAISLRALASRLSGRAVRPGYLHRRDCRARLERCFRRVAGGHDIPVPFHGCGAGHAGRADARTRAAPDRQFRVRRVQAHRAAAGGVNAFSDQTLPCKCLSPALLVWPSGPYKPPPKARSSSVIAC